MSIFLRIITLAATARPTIRDIIAAKRLLAYPRLSGAVYLLQNDKMNTNVLRLKRRKHISMYIRFNWNSYRRTRITV